MSDSVKSNYVVCIGEFYAERGKGGEFYLIKKRDQIEK